MSAWPHTYIVSAADSHVIITSPLITHPLFSHKQLVRSPAPRVPMTLVISFNGIQVHWLHVGRTHTDTINH